MNSIKLNLFIALLILMFGALIFMPTKYVNIEADLPKVGEISKRTIVSPITFDLMKTKSELQKERNLAKDRVLATFDYDQEKTAESLKAFDLIMDQIKNYHNLQFQINSGLDADNIILDSAQKVFHDLSLVLSTTAIKELSQNKDARELLINKFHDMQKEGIADVYVASSQKQLDLFRQRSQLPAASTLLYNKSSIKLIRENQSSIQAIGILMTKENAVDKTFPLLQLKFPGKQALQSAFYEVLYGYAQANIIYLSRLTKYEQEEAAAQINPSKGKVFKGMTIIGRGELISEESYEKITVMQKELNSEKSKGIINLPLLAKNTIISLLVVFFTIIYFIFGITANRKFRLSKIWAIVTIITIQFLAFYFVNHLGTYLVANTNADFFTSIELRWLYPFLIAPTLSTMLLGIRAGIIVSLFTVSYMGIINGFDLVSTMSAFSVSVITIYFLKDLKSRREFTLASLMSLLSFGATFFLESALKSQTKQEYLISNGISGGIIILLSIAVVIIFLANLFEKAFSLTTKLTLMELVDFNSKALRDFSTNVPSSFNHSIMVANLAEKAAHNIKANSILVRAMALYHDIGKSKNSKYFTENQKKPRDQELHKKLTPHESAKIIKSHVSDGVILAKEYGIPPVVRAAIPEHHGDGLISFFYDIALQNAKPGEKVNIKDFCYDGPKPQSKETAIIMLADAVEAISRSIDASDPEMIVKTVRKVVYSRLEENQLNESGLKISDLEGIERGFLQVFEGMFHTRVTYPEKR